MVQFLWKKHVKSLILDLKLTLFNSAVQYTELLIKKLLSESDQKSEPLGCASRDQKSNFISYFYSTTNHDILKISNHNLLCSLDPPNQSKLFWVVGPMLVNDTEYNWLPHQVMILDR